MTYPDIDPPDWTRPIRPNYLPASPVKYPATITEAAAKVILKTDSTEIGKPTRYDAGKTNWSLLPFDALEEITKVLDFGAAKYAAHNWKLGEGFKYTKVLNCILRHVFAYMRGEDKDPESGLSHLAHAGCNILFLLYYEKYKERYSNDDRA